MGGTYKGWGNMTLTGEFNLWTDPEASRIVYESFPFIHLLPWEVADDFIVSAEDRERLFEKSNACLSTNLFEHINKINDSIDG